MIHFLGKSKRLAYTREIPIMAICFYGFLMAATQLLFVEFQCFFLGTFCCISHVTLSWFLYTVNVTGQSTADEYLSEETSSFRILQSVDGKYLPALHIGQSKHRLDVIKTFLELSLVTLN